MQLNKNKAGLILGSFMGLMHLAWSVMVAAGSAQALLDLVFHFHFLNNPLVVGAFSVRTAVILIALTFLVGYVVGWVLAFLWNTVHKK